MTSTARSTNWLFGLIFGVVWVGLLFAPANSRSMGDWPLYMIYLQVLADGFGALLYGPIMLSLLIQWASAFAVAWSVSWLWERRLRSRSA